MVSFVRASALCVDLARCWFMWSEKKWGQVDPRERRQTDCGYVGSVRFNIYINVCVFKNDRPAADDRRRQAMQLMEETSMTINNDLRK